MIPQPTETAVVVPVPTAEATVGRWRSQLDPSAGWGVLAHVTVLYPFLPPDRIDEAVLAALGEVVGSVPAFDVEFTQVQWFGDTVVWLAPEPADPFRALTAAVAQRFPEAPPYGGEHGEVLPHLTVGNGAPLGLLREAAREVAAHLPIRMAVRHVQVLQGTAAPNSWTTVADLPLGVVPPSSTAGWAPGADLARGVSDPATQETRPPHR